MYLEFSLGLDQAAILGQCMILELTSQIELDLISKQYQVAILISLNGFSLKRSHLNISVSWRVDLQAIQGIVMYLDLIFQGLKINTIQLRDKLEYLRCEIDGDASDT